ncbi:MAG: efflux transporter outer membrane subunit [Acetobacter sp.]|nr:efflux transporter outer membrane subunit [Acetobacter sp.]MCH4060122.1 efflux transporter outer membrane subunit [Acetobacter sp.]MCH4087062.1 efflux transporter outer membrane subunit [Acetobacter sp.]MCI1292882.1 efflux transporter outer membrane subunit [Acetobacter sp.]MCI1319468.1 efflux transporter outer membrane subunit [Acetobacter sp.]
MRVLKCLTTIGLMTALTSLGACNLAPRYRQPPPPVPAEYPRQVKGDMPLAVISELSWQTFFPDETLRYLIRLSLAQNRDLQAAAARIEEARNTVSVQGSALLPQINATAIGGQSLISANSRLPGLDSTPAFYSGTIGANWEIDFWGRLRNIRETARQQFLASEEARRALATSLVEQVARTYLADRAYNDRITLARSTIATRTESWRITRRRYEVGAAAKIDATQAEALLHEAEQDLQALEQAREQNLNALALLVGAPVTLPEGSLTFSDSYLTHPLPTGLPSALLTHRPDIMEAERRLVAMHANIGAARAAFLPRVIVTGAGGTASSDFNALFGGGSGTWSFLPVVSMPLFSGFRNLGNLRLAEAERKEALATYEKTIQSAFRDVADALAARHWTQGRIKAEEQELSALQERTRLAQRRYVTGYAAYLEVLEAQRDQFSAEQNLVQLHQAYLNSAVDLYAAVGGGFPENPSAVHETAPRNAP